MVFKVKAKYGHLKCIYYTGFSLLTMLSHVLQKVTDKLFTYVMFRVPILPQIIPCSENDVCVFKSCAQYGEVNKYVAERKNNRYFRGQLDSLQSKHNLYRL